MKTASACAKFILGGEHSVVVRGLALAFPLPHVTLTVSISDLDQTAKTDRRLTINGTLRSQEELAIVQNLCLRLGAKFAPSIIDIESLVPMGAGLGSSAALSTALAKIFSPGLNENDLAKVALNGEELFHRHPSGVDPFTIAIGRPIIFRSENKAWKPLPCEKFLKAGLSFALFNSGLTHKTAEVQAIVAEKKTEHPDIYESLMDALANNVKEMQAAFENGNGPQLGHLMNSSHSYLHQLGVCPPEINELTKNVLALEGCLGAKLTGAGCGGFVLGLFSRRQHPQTKPPVDGRKAATIIQPAFVWPE